MASGTKHAGRPTRLDRTVAYIRKQAGERRAHLELNALVQFVVITDDRKAVAQQVADRVHGLTVEDALATPFLALGTHDRSPTTSWRVASGGDLLLL